MKEKWRYVKGSDAYIVSDKGNVKSITRQVERKNGTKAIYQGKPLVPIAISEGYLLVDICKEGTIKKRYIHQLMAESFLDHEVDGHRSIVIHKDQNKKNNDLKNLTIGTHRTLTDEYRIY